MPQSRSRTALLPAPFGGQAGVPLAPPSSGAGRTPRQFGGGGAVLLSFRALSDGESFSPGIYPQAPQRRGAASGEEGRVFCRAAAQSRLPLHMEALLSAPLAKPYVSLRVQRALAGRACGAGMELPPSRLFPTCGTLRTHNTQLRFQHKKPPLPQIKHLQGGTGAFHRPFPPSREGPFSARSAASSPGTLSRARPPGRSGS